MVNIPTNKKLYSKVKSETKRKFTVWPSAYGSAWLVREYKKRNGRYRTSKSKPKKKSRKSKSKPKKKSRKSKSKPRKKSRKSKSKPKKKSKVNMRFSSSRKSGLSRWFAEQWIDVCKLPKIVPCGRKNVNTGKYPYCRPRYKISSKSPITARSLSKSEIKRRCSHKRRNPYRKVSSIKKSRKRRSNRK
jgi:hypothetical protein